MSDTTDLTSRFRLGDDIHFSYDNQSQPTTSESPAPSSSNKKKKKKANKKHKQPVEATLNNPEDDYPTSRVIKQAPNGDVIVESLDDEASHQNQENHRHHHQYTNIWDSASIEEQENLKLFWESLDESLKMELVKIDKKSIMEIFKNETKANNQSHHGHGANGTSSASGANSAANANPVTPSCACKYCGRRSTIIEDELENIYDNHFDDIIDFIHEIRDINDLNALPGLLFGGFHMLEEEHKLQKRQQRMKHKRDHPASQNHTENPEVHGEHPHVQPQNFVNLRAPADSINTSVVDNRTPYPVAAGSIGAKQLQHQQQLQQQLQQQQLRQLQQQLQQEQNVHSQPQQSLQMQQQLNENDLPGGNTLDLAKHLEKMSLEDKKGEYTNERKIFQKLLDPKLVEVLDKVDFEKVKSGNYVGSASQANLFQRADCLREIVRDLHKADKTQLEQGLSFLKNISSIFSNSKTPFPADVTSNPRNFSSKFNDQLSNFAEDLLKNDGNSFIEMMESLSESRTAREDLLKDPTKKDAQAWVDEDDNNDSKRPDASTVKQPSQEYEYYEESEEDEEELSEEDEDDADDNGLNEDDDLVQDGHHDDSASDTESEISEEEKMQEIRRLFLIQVIKLFQERLKSAYKEKLSEDRTQKLIEELEAEENAKKERELKKLKQKEKAKEKKRLQQLAKEEEKKKKEEEQRAKEEELKQKQEALKADQRRRKEEAKLKREEEKKKRIEELKRKEEEHKKKVEAQQKKEEEAKKLKEERKKKAEEERKKKEEEKRQKELLKKQKEEERERLKLEAEENERLEKEQQELQELQELQNQLELESAQLPAELAEEINASPDSFSPTKNHLLEQLYQARPSSVSGPTTISPPIQFTPEAVPPVAAVLSVVPSVVPISPALSGAILNGTGSPNSRNAMLYGSSAQAQLPNGLNSSTSNMSPWSSKSRLNSTSGASLQLNLFQPQLLASGFSPFNDFSTPATSAGIGSVNVNAPLASTAVEPLAGANNGGVWNPSTTSSRNNSIWSNTPNLNNASIWGNTLPSLAGGAGAGASTPSAAHTLPNSAPLASDNELIQVAAYNTFQMLQNSNQLEFGAAPLMKLFLGVKLLLGNNALTINQLLSSCDSTSVYHFEFVYDDFGTVTHVKVNFNNGGLAQSLQSQAAPTLLNNTLATSAAGLRSSPPPGLGTKASTGSVPLSQFRFNINDANSPLLSNLGDWSSGNNSTNANGNSSNGGSRGLWN